MSIDEAIKVLKEYLALDKDIDSEYLEAQRVVIKAMEQAPSSASTRRWIPVGERLPDVEYGFSDIYSEDGTPLLFEYFGSERVLVSYISNETKKTEMCVSRYSVWKYEDGTRDVSWDSVDFDYEESNPYNIGTISSNEYEGGKVIAWMPLPEPYKESEE